MDHPINYEQQNVNIPYIFVRRPDTPTEGLSLLVSTPDGKILDYDIDEDQARELPGVLSSKGFWDAVFTSLIASFVAK